MGEGIKFEPSLLVSDLNSGSRNEQGTGDIGTVRERPCIQAAV